MSGKREAFVTLLTSGTGGIEWAGAGPWTATQMLECGMLEEIEDRAFVVTPAGPGLAPGWLLQVLSIEAITRECSTAIIQTAKAAEQETQRQVGVEKAKRILLEKAVGRIGRLEECACGAPRLPYSRRFIQPVCALGHNKRITEGWSPEVLARWIETGVRRKGAWEKITMSDLYADLCSDFIDVPPCPHTKRAFVALATDCLEAYLASEVVA